jgi:hypothetical protein
VNTLCESDVLEHKIIDSPETANVEEGITIKPANIGEYLHLYFLNPRPYIYYRA